VIIYLILSILHYIILYFKSLTLKSTGKRPLGRPRRRWEDKIIMDLEEIGISAGNWVDSAQDRNYWGALVNAALYLRVP
jgi:hypothetical protein